jgi:hypothetical protein
MYRALRLEAGRPECLKAKRRKGAIFLVELSGLIGQNHTLRII